MQLTYNNNQFVCVSKIEEKDIPKNAGFRWNPDNKFWATTNIDIAIKLNVYADDTAKMELERLLAKQKAKIEASRLTDINIDFPVPEDLKYLGYQKAGIAYAIDKNATLLADEMGLGKTIQAIGVINAKEDIKKVIIVCPASLKINWQRELEKWLVKPLTVGIAGKKFPEADIIIINYDILKKYQANLEKQNWDLIVMDEAHYVKNSKAARSKVAKEIAEKAKNKILITGTPIANRPAELWHLLHILNPQKWDNFFNFAKRYCDAERTSYGWDFSGASNLKELQNLLRENVMVRRLKKDVLTELPAKRRQIITIEADKEAQQLIKQQTSQLDALKELGKERKALTKQKSTMSEEEYRNAVRALNARSAATIGEIAVLRHKTALAKVPAVVEHCVAALEETNKIVVFAHHKDVIAEIKAGLSEYKPVCITGDMSTDERQQAVDSFQNNDNCRVFIGSITAAGVGITLTAASTVIFAELDWVPGNLTQAEDRCHRIGQHDSVLVQHIIYENSVDAYLAQKIVAKQDIIEQVVDMEEDVLNVLE